MREAMLSICWAFAIGPVRRIRYVDSAREAELSLASGRGCGGIALLLLDRISCSKASREYPCASFSDWSRGHNSPDTLHREKSFR